MKKFLFLTAILFFASSLFAQVVIRENPFKPLKPPSRSVLKKASLNNYYIAYRLISPFAAYSFTTQQMSTGVGYGWNKMHFIDSTQSYYTDLSISVVICLNGNVIPTPYNFTSIGASFGIKNNLFMLIPAYVIPFGGKKGGIDIKASFGFKF